VSLGSFSDAQSSAETLCVAINRKKRLVSALVINKISCQYSGVMVPSISLFAIFQVSAAVYLRSSLFSDVTRLRVQTHTERRG
jgi:hypothetical protein